MRYRNERLFRGQLEYPRRQFVADGGLPFADVLSRQIDEEALDTVEVIWNERISPPLVNSTAPNLHQLAYRCHRQDAPFRSAVAFKHRIFGTD
jgi:hypothetical protein